MNSDGIKSQADQSTHPTDETTQRIIDWAVKRDPIRAVLLTSTRAIPGADVDALSDYDVILILQDIHPFVTDRLWLNDFGQVLIAYWDPIYPYPTHGIDVCANVVQYDNGLKIDFTLWPVSFLEHVVASPALPAELDVGYCVLLDKDHFTDKLQPPTGVAYIPYQPSLEAYETSINDFLSDAPYVAKCLWRNELFPSKWCLDVDMKHVYLRQMLEWRLEIDHGWSKPVGSLGNGLKKLLPAHLWNQVEKTYAGSVISENWEALFTTMDLFRKGAAEVGEQFAYPYPNELHGRVRAYVETIHSLRKV